MQILIVPDSFKESCSATKIAEAIERGVRKVFPRATIHCLPFSDGGEGALAILKKNCTGKLESATVHNANGKPITAHYFCPINSTVAWVELAQASGLEQIERKSRNPLTASTYGTGQLIKHAIEKGRKEIRLSLGGSATNDAGTGILRALGGKLLDVNNREIPLGGLALKRLHRIEIPPLSKTIDWVIACDVDNPLLGLEGASKTYAPQKGASAQEAEQLEESLAHFAKVVMQQFGRDITKLAGGGAAGGTAAGLFGLFDAKLCAGFDLMANTVNLSDAIASSQLIFTAEGRIDQQSLRGKVPVGVARLAKKNNRPCLAIAGSIDPNAYSALYAEGFTGLFTLQHAPISLEKSIKETEQLLSFAAENACHLMKKTHFL